MDRLQIFSHVSLFVLQSINKMKTNGQIKIVMEACLWGFYGGWIFELQWGPLMVIFHHGDAAEDKGKEVRGGAIH